MIDPRTIVIDERLEGVRRIVAVSSGKGGVGKSMVATALALTLSNKGYKVGLFDLDFTGPSTHIILGAPVDLQPKEEKGIIPPTFDGLVYMSLVYYVGNKAAPLRGAEISNALIELLAITQWGKLDFLIIDMPPGISDAVLDLVRLVKRIEFLIVTTPSFLAFEVVKKQVSLLCELDMPIIGVVENMKMDKANGIKLATQKLRLAYLGAIPYDASVETSIGNPAKLMETSVGKSIPEIFGTNISKKRTQKCRVKR